VAMISHAITVISKAVEYLSPGETVVTACDQPLCKLTAILRRQFCIILTAIWKKIYFVLVGFSYSCITVQSFLGKTNGKLRIYCTDCKINSYNLSSVEHECLYALSNLCFAENYQNMDDDAYCVFSKAKTCFTGYYKKKVNESLGWNDHVLR